MTIENALQAYELTKRFEDDAPVRANQTVARVMNEVWVIAAEGGTSTDVEVCTSNRGDRMAAKLTIAILCDRGFRVYLFRYAPLISFRVGIRVCWGPHVRSEEDVSKPLDEKWLED